MGAGAAIGLFQLGARAGAQALARGARHASRLASTVTPASLKLSRSYDFRDPPIRQVPPWVMALHHFTPPENGESVDAYDARMEAQPTLQWTDCKKQLGSEDPHLPTVHNVHEGEMFYGYHFNPNNGKRERYLIKGFREPELPLAQREIAAAYFGHALGPDIAKYFPKVYGIKEDGFLAVIRRFVRGTDTRFVPGNPEEAKKIPLEDTLALLTIDILLAQNDIDNIRNLIRTQRSEVVHSPLCPIDFERIMPNPRLMRILQRRGIERQWKDGDAIKGTFRWRRECTKEMGEEEFVDALMSYKYVGDNPTMNPYLAILKEQGHKTKADLEKLTLPDALIDKILTTAPKLNGIMLGMNITDLTSMHQTMEAWRYCRENNIPITVAMLISASYPEPVVQPPRIFQPFQITV